MLPSLLLLAGVRANQAPLAPHRNLCTSWSAGSVSEADVCLRGLDLDGDAVTATVTALPAGGAAFHRSQVYEKHGYSPKTGVALKANDVVYTRNNCVLWRDPLAAGGSGAAACGPLAPEHCRFAYKVTDADGLSSATGYVTLLDQANPALLSEFGAGAEGWTVVGNGNGAAAAAQAPSWEPSTRGLMSYYVHARDAVIAGQSQALQRQREGAVFACDAQRGCSDTQQWYFQAPARFLGFQGMHYGGELVFNLMSPSGDFAQANLNDGGRQDLVVLECASCATNKGVRLVLRMANGQAGAAPYRTFDGAARQFRVPLTEAEWLKDPKSTLLTWKQPTQCEMMEVLAHLSAVRVLGDHTKWHESVALDSFGFVASCAAQVPLYCSAQRGAETLAASKCESCLSPANGQCPQHVVMDA